MLERLGSEVTATIVQPGGAQLNLYILSTLNIAMVRWHIENISQKSEYSKILI